MGARPYRLRSRACASPPGPRACELAAIAVCVLVAVLVLTPLTLLRDLPNAYDTDAFYAPFAAFLHERLATATSRSGTRSRSRAIRSPPIRSRACSTRRRSCRTACWRRRAGWSPSSRSTTCSRRSRRTRSRASAAPGAWARCTPGIAFGAGGYLLARSQALGLLTGAAWLAASVAAAQYAATRQGRGASPLILAGTLALSILGGSQQLTLVAATSALVVLVLQLRWRGLAVFAGAGAVALGLAAVAILPRLELVQPLVGLHGSERPGRRRRAAWSDADLVFGAFGSHAGELAPLYAGALMPALAATAVIRRWSAARVPLVLAIVAILWSIGLAGFLAHPFGPLRSITSHQAVRALPLLALALAALAGIAFGRPGSRPSPWLVAALAVVTTLVIEPDVLTHRWWLGPAIAMLILLALLRSRRTLVAVLACALVPAVLAIDLVRHDYRQQNPHQPAANWDPASETFPPAPETARFLLARRAAEGPTRFATLANDFTLRKQLRFGRSAEHRNLLLDMAGTRYGLEDVAGYDPVQLLAYRDAINASNGNPQPDRHFLWVEVAPKRLLRELGVRYYVAQEGQVLTQAEGRAAHADRHRAARRQGAADRADQPPGRDCGDPGRTDAARIVVREPDRVVVESPPGPAGRLVLADPPYPGWSVTVDGKPATERVQRGLFRAVDLPAGPHRVEWRFQPASVKHGLIISLATLVAALAYAVRARRRERAR